MSVTSKIEPVEGYEAYAVDITITLDQLQKDAQSFIAELIAGGIPPVGLYFEDFVSTVLRQRMVRLAAKANQMGFIFVCPPWMVLDDEESDGPCIHFILPDKLNAVAFKMALL